MRSVVIAPVGDTLDALFIGLREFPAQKVILLSMPEKHPIAEQAKQELEKFGISLSVETVDEMSVERVLTKIAAIKQAETDAYLIINAATGDRAGMCAALCAAFVNGLKAFGVENNQIVTYPSLPFSYYALLTERKISLLALLLENPKTLEQLSQGTGMSLPLISYHLNGTLKADGLKKLGLIETTEKRGRVTVSISPLGRIIISGLLSSSRKNSAQSAVQSSLPQPPSRRLLPLPPPEPAQEQ